MVLDETNESYVYLRNIGSTWMYDATKVHPKLVERLYKRYDTFDRNADGTLSMEEVLFWPDRMKTLVKTSDEELEAMRSAIRIFFGAVGVTKEGLKREDWVEANQVFAEAEKERKRRGEESLVALLGNTYFDVIDQDDDGTVTLAELKIMMKAFDVPEEAAYTFFDHADSDKNGALDRYEMHELFSKFWLEDYDPKYDMIYAGKY